MSTNTNAVQVLTNEIEGLVFEETETVGADKSLVNHGTTRTKEVEDELVKEIRYENVWKKMDGRARIGAKKLWDDLFGDQMPCAVKNGRLDFLCVVAYCGDELVAVSTVIPEMSSVIFCNVGWFRCVVKEEFRRKGIFTQILLRAKKALEEWSLESPLESVTALGAMLEFSFDGENMNNKNPVWTETGLTLVGYSSQGVQIRIAWLKDARVEY
mmetsp:Transcript_19670/g.45752  ORF Transcript_19670/g.45752 Transcript_19670/m.45752 type:complete len:213 (-) Transcript_19670:614-1252(-)